jgi:sortase A
LTTDTGTRPLPTAFPVPATARRRGRRRALVATRTREPLSATRLAVAGGCATLLALTGWMVVYALFLSAFQEHHDQQVMYSHLREKLALATVPIGGQIARGTPIALLDAPAAGLHDTVVVEGAASSQLESGPGHFPASPLPGQAGVSVIYGRSATFGAPFGSLSTLRPGSTFSVTTGQGTFGYQVLDVRVAGDPLPAPLAAGRSRLTLVTSAEHGWRSGWSPTQALYVDADLVHGAVQPTPAGQPTQVSAADQPFHADTSHLMQLVLWLELLLIVAAGLTWSWLRWNRTQTWLLGLPLALAVLWGTAGAAAPLLPNLV